ncbi:MAG: hypothetical protein ACOC3Y_05705 [Desulfohalobiaceae bacterium]
MGIVERNQRNIDNKYWCPEQDSFPVKSRYTVTVQLTPSYAAG